MENTPTNEETPEETETAPSAAPPRLRRRQEGRLLAGVCAGAAAYLDLDVNIVRVVMVALCFAGGLGLPLYAAAWLLVPEEGCEEPIASDFVHRLQHLG